MKLPDAKAVVGKEWEKLEKWHLTKVRSKKEVIQEAQKEGQFILLRWWTYVVLRGDMVKDDSGASAVFTGQGSSASQVTAAKAMDVIARLPDCDGQAADAVSAYTQVLMEDAPKLLKIQKSQCSDIWIRLPRHKWPKSWSNSEDLVVLLERNLHGHPLAGLLWERQFEEVLMELGWRKVPNWECLLVHRQQGLFLSVYVDDIKVCWKEAKSRSHVETIDEIRWSGRAYVVSWSRVGGMHPTRM